MVQVSPFKEKKMKKVTLLVVLGSVCLTSGCVATTAAMLAMWTPIFSTMITAIEQMLGM